MTEQQDRWSGTLVLGSGVVVYYGPGSVASSHRHDAIQLMWSPDRPFRLEVAETMLVGHAAVVPGREPHALEAAGDELVIVFVEPAGQLGRRLTGFAEANVGVELGERLGGTVLPPKEDPEAALAWGRQAIAQITGEPAGARYNGVRPEVVAASDYIESHLEGSPPLLTDAAHHVGLSSRQLSRSFTAEVGMPFRRYVIWSRIRRAVVTVRDGADLTTAAAVAGFADSAHLSRVFRQMFGLAPSEVLPLVRIAEADVAVS